MEIIILIIRKNANELCSQLHLAICNTISKVKIIFPG